MCNLLIRKAREITLEVRRELLQYAEKYEVEDLVKFCLNHLLAIENAIDFLKTSYLHFGC